jgi:predicted helicase
MRTKDTKGSVSYPIAIPRPLYERFRKLAKTEHTTIVWQMLKALRERFDKPNCKRCSDD